MQLVGRKLTSAPSFQVEFTSIYIVLWVFKLCYAHTVRMSDLLQYCHVAEEFVACVATAVPEMLHKVKIHLLLHLPSNLVEF